MALIEGRNLVVVDENEMGIWKWSIRIGNLWEKLKGAACEPFRSI
jgi:hypothetical protein